jgi:ankyrin repeat protein
MLDAVLGDTNMNKADINGTVPQNYLLNKTDNTQLIDVALKHVGTVSDDLLWQVVQNGDAATLQKLVAKGGNVNAKNGQGISLLEWILQNKDDEKLLQALVSPSLEVNTPDANGKLPLEIAAKNNDSAAVKFLLQQGADVNIKVDDNLLIGTLTTDQEEVTKLLLGANADLQYVNPKKQTILMLAVEQLNLPLIEAYIAQYKDNISARDNFGNTALHYVASVAEKYVEFTAEKLMPKMEKCLQLLTDSGLDINEQNGNGETLAIRLAQGKAPHRSELETLLQKFGADLAIKDQYRKTAADYWDK